MSKQYVCDITGEQCTENDLNVHVVQKADVQYQGKTITWEVIVRIDVNGADPKTNIAPDVWPLILGYIKNQVFP